MEYMILSSSNCEMLIKLVMEAIKEGYTPLGGVCVSNWVDQHDYDSVKSEYVQAMIKESK